MDELLVEFSGELSGHIHVAWFPPSPLLTIQQLHSEKENLAREYVKLKVANSIKLFSSCTQTIKPNHCFNEILPSLLCIKTERR